MQVLCSAFSPSPDFDTNATRLHSEMSTCSRVTHSWRVTITKPCNYFTMMRIHSKNTICWGDKALDDLESWTVRA